MDASKSHSMAKQSQPGKNQLKSQMPGKIKIPFLSFFATFLSLLGENLTEGVNSVPRSCFTCSVKKIKNKTTSSYL